MIGYFIGNEPPWPGREPQFVDLILAGPPGDMQKRPEAHLAAGDTPERRKAFVVAAFERYLETINAAVRRHEPNHLNLGIRFGGDPPVDGARRRARLRRLQREHLPLRAAACRRWTASTSSTGRPILDRRVPHRRARTRARAGPRAGEGPGGARRRRTATTWSRRFAPGDGRHALVPVGRPAVHRPQRRRELQHRVRGRRPTGRTRELVSGGEDDARAPGRRPPGRRRRRSIACRSHAEEGLAGTTATRLGALGFWLLALEGSRLSRLWAPGSRRDPMPPPAARLLPGRGVTALPGRGVTEAVPARALLSAGTVLPRAARA